MELQHNERTQVRRPVQPPVNLDDGRLDVGRAAQAAAFVGVALVVSLAGASLARAGAAAGEGWGAVVAVGVAIVAVALLFGGVVLFVSITEFLDRRRRVADWHAVMLEAYQELGAAETVEQVSEYTLTTENPAHVLLAALWVHLQVREGKDTPYSARALRGPVFLAHRRAFELSKMGGEQMSRRFAELGLVRGRREGHAGEWAPGTADEVIDTVLARWH